MGTAARLRVIEGRWLAVGATEAEAEADGVSGASAVRVGGSSWVGVPSLADAEAVAVGLEEADGGAIAEAVLCAVPLTLSARLSEGERFCVGDVEAGAVGEAPLRAMDVVADSVWEVLELREWLRDAVAVADAVSTAVAVPIAVALRLAA